MKNRILCLFAHPDDEVFATGTLLERIGAGDEVVFVCATDGQAALPEGAPEHLRREELRAAADICGVREIIFLGLMDGKLSSEYDMQILAKDLQRILHAVAPTLVLTFPPDGITGHPDHVFVHHLVCESCEGTSHAKDGSGPDAPQIVFWNSEHPVYRKTFLKNARSETGAASRLDRSLLIERDVRPYYPKKLEALYCHQSQRFVRYVQTLSEEERMDLLGHEYFFIERSARGNIPL